MRATASQASATGKSSFRDKRYTMPCLLVDLFSGVHETRFWSATQLILREVATGLAVGDDLIGAFTFDDDPTCGLFQARVARLDAARQLAGAEFRWLSPTGHDLIADRLAARRPDAADQTPVMKVSISHQTANWSLSGMLLERYRGALEPGQIFKGMIRVEKTQEPGHFTASVIRVNPERQTLALKFQELSAGTFGLLEAAIKKSNAN